MSIASVQQAIREIRKRVEDYPIEQYRYREMETRYALIDPIIEALGWEMSNFDQCAYESDPRWETWHERFADYVFWGDGHDKAVLVIEAKQAKNDLSSPTEEAQLAGYVEGLDTGVAVLTNGKVWYLYDLDLKRRRKFANKLVEEVYILEGNMREAARVLHEWLSVQNWW